MQAEIACKDTTIVVCWDQAVFNSQSLIDRDLKMPDNILDALNNELEIHHFGRFE